MKPSIGDSSAEHIGQYNNIEMSSDDAKMMLDWLDAQKKMIEEADPENPMAPFLGGLSELIEVTYNLGHAHTEDTKQAVSIIIAADYAPIEADPSEDTVEEAPKANPEDGSNEVGAPV